MTALTTVFTLCGVATLTKGFMRLIDKLEH